MCKHAYRPRLATTGINDVAHAGERTADKEHMVDMPTAVGIISAAYANEYMADEYLQVARLN